VYPLRLIIQPRTVTDNIQITMRQPNEVPFYQLDWLSPFQRVFVSVGGAEKALEFRGLNVPVANWHRYEMLPLTVTQSTYEFYSRYSPWLYNRPKMIPSLIGPRSFFSGMAGEVGSGGVFYFIVGPPYTGAVRFDLVLLDIDSGQILDPKSIFANTTWIINYDYSGAPIPVEAYSWFARNLSLRIVPNVTTYHVNSTFTDARVFKKPSGTYSLTESGSPDPTWSKTDSFTPPPTPTKTFPTKTISITADETRTNSFGTDTLSDTPDRSVSRTFTDRLTDTRSGNTRSISADITATISLSDSKSGSPDPSESKSLTPDSTETLSTSLSPSRTSTRSISRSLSSDRSLSASQSADRSLSFTLSISDNISESKTPSPDLSESKSLSETETKTKRSATKSPSPADSQTFSETATLSRSPTPSESLTESSTADETRTPSLTTSRTISLSRSLSPDPTQSISLSQSFSESRSVSPSKSVSISRSGTGDETITRTLTPPPTPTRSLSETQSLSPERTSSVSGSADVTATESDRLTPTKTFTRFSPTPIPTPSHSATWTGETPTLTFHLWDTCSEGWAAYEEFCYKHFSALSYDHRPNETLISEYTFDDALSFCKTEHKATIAPIQNLAQVQFLISMVGKNSGRKFWNGVYRDSRFKKPVWRTPYSRTGFNDFFIWDNKRRMPHLEDDCILFHIANDLSRRLVGGSNAMITYPCHSRAEVVCSRLRYPWSVTAVNGTNSGPVIAIEDKPLILHIVGNRLPKFFGVQLQTTNYKTHNGLEGEPTHCTQSRPRTPVSMINGSTIPAYAFNVSDLYSFNPLCNGTCTKALLKFPPPAQLGLVRGHRYSMCFFLPYDFDFPISSDEFRWDFLPNSYVEVYQSERSYLEETCVRHQQLVELLYFDANATDTTRPVQTPWFFDGPREPTNWEWMKHGLN
jgi:hypothetical protein